MNGLELSSAQKALGPVVNFIVERFFPNAAFFGRDYVRDISGLVKGDELGPGVHCAQALIGLAIELNATELEARVDGLTYQGRSVGDWVLRIDNISAGADFPVSQPVEGRVTAVKYSCDVKTGLKDVQIQYEKGGGKVMTDPATVRAAV